MTDQSRRPSSESRLADLVRSHGPLTVAAFIDFALYDSEFGYYARAAQRSGRAGDFFTSVDVGPLFGELLAAQLAECSRILNSRFPVLDPFDLVEAGAGNGRLSADILRAVRSRHPDLYECLRLHLVEASAGARAAQRATLGDMADRLVSSGEALPESFEGVLFANELVDALPVHQVVMREDGLREVFVDLDERGPGRAALHETEARPEKAALHGARDEAERANVGRPFHGRLIERAPSTPALQEYLDRLGVTLEPGWRVEINLRAVAWMRDAARRLRRGFIILIDYGHQARELYSATHSAGTLTAFSRHQSSGPESGAGAPSWLQRPGEQDITAHVDFTSLQAAAEAEGMTTIALLDQTYFVLGLIAGWSATELARRAGALKTLMIPGGIGSTHKVLILGKGVGTPALQACSFSVRVT
jgi:SAM-dependent MidA family methyltransferase